jgi:hypothetical protein
VRFFTDWQELAAPSPFYASPVNWVKLALGVHLCFAVPTAFLWAYVVWHAVAKIPDPPRPSPHSAHHKRFGWFAAWGMAGTAATGWIFYYLAFVA